MRRLCTDRERKVLKQNWKNISTDFSAKSAHFRTGDAFLVVLFWMITWYGLIFLLIDYLGRWTLFLMGILSSILAVRIVNFVLSEIRIRRIKKKFLKKQGLMINGATVVSVKDDVLEVEYTFIEDDEYLTGGAPYGITVKSYKCDVKGIKTGERLLLIYEDDGQLGASGDVSLQIMRMTPEVENMISKECPFEMEKLNLKKLTCFPHPNAAKMVKEVHTLTSSQKEEMKMWFVKKEKRVARIIVAIFGAGLFGGLNSVVVILMQKEKFNGLQGKTLGIYILMNLIIVLMLSFLWWICNKRIKKDFSEIVYVQEILFKAVKSGQKSQTYPVFYEWNGSKFVEKEYPYAAFRADYGKVFRIYSGEKGVIIMGKK